LFARVTIGVLSSIVFIIDVYMTHKFYATVNRFVAILAHNVKIINIVLYVLVIAFLGRAVCELLWSKSGSIFRRLVFPNVES